MTPPPLARQHTVKGAEEFVRYYIGLLDTAFVTGELDQYLAASAPDCESCQYQARVLRADYAAGERYRGGRTKIVSLASPYDEARPPMPVVVSVLREPLVKLDRHGKPSRTWAPKEELTYLFNVRWESGKWIMQDYENLGER